MTTQANSTEYEVRKTRVIQRGGASEAVYGLGLIGAWVYYFSHATSFSLVVLAFFKGIFWPAFLIYQLLNYLHL